MQMQLGGGSLNRQFKGKGGAWGAILFGGVFLLLSPMWIDSDSWFSWFGFSVFVAVGAFVAGSGIKILIAAAAFKTATLTSWDSTLLGGTAVVSLQLDPKKPLNLNGAKLTVFCEEWAHYSAGTDSRTYTEKLWEQVLPVEMPKILQGPYQVELKIAIPTTIPPTFNGTHNKLRTVARFDLDIDRWPDLQLESDLTVLAEVKP